MCGVIGTFQRSGTPHPLQKSDLNRIAHRGPDDMGIYHDEHVCFGHVRLAIIDLSPEGAQPMSYGDRYWITFNGEIYNYIELKRELESLGHTFKTKSDTEVLLASYAEWKEECLSRLKGMFAFAIWDKQKKEVFLARDRFGEKPLIYSVENERLVFASEFKALIPLLKNQTEIDFDSVDQFLHYQYVPEPHTLLKGAKKLPAGHYLKISLSDWEITPVSYWSIETPGKNAKDLDFTSIKEHLESAVNYCLRTDVPVGIALSGGIDSGAIASFAAKLSKKPLQAFAVGYPGRPAFDERDQAKKLAESLGIPLHEVEIPVHEFSKFFPRLIEILDEPIGDIAALGHFAIPKAAKDHGIKVILTGIGGDEIFWGYKWVSKIVQLNQKRLKKHYRLPAELITKDSILHRAIKRLALIRFVPLWLKAYFELISELCSIGPLPDNELYFFEIIPDYLFAKEKKKSLYQREWKKTPSRKIQKASELPLGSEEIPEHVMKLLSDTWLVSNCLNLGDRVSMAVGVESRLPFLDVDLVELLMSFRKKTKDHDLAQKEWLKKSLVDVLPGEVLNRPKRGFQPPVIDWLSSIVENYFSAVQNGRLIKLGMISSTNLSEMYERRGRREWATLFYLYKLIMLEMWFDKFLGDTNEV